MQNTNSEFKFLNFLHIKVLMFVFRHYLFTDTNKATMCRSIFQALLVLPFYRPIKERFFGNQLNAFLAITWMNMTFWVFIMLEIQFFVDTFFSITALAAFNPKTRKALAAVFVGIKGLRAFYWKISGISGVSALLPAK